MFEKKLLQIAHPRPTDDEGLVLLEGAEEGEMIFSGKAVSLVSGEKYPVKSGYLDLLGRRSGADNIANLTNFLPGAGRGYEPLWRVRSLDILTGEEFSNEREVEIMAGLSGVEKGGVFLDLGCSAGLYTRSLAKVLGGEGSVVGIDISPSMLREAARRAKRFGASSSSLPSFARADAENLPFADESMDGALCGGSLNEFGDPGRVLRETRRVLRSEGRIAIMGILRARTKNGLRLQKLLSMGGVRFFEEDEIRSMLARSGFDSDVFRTFGSVFFAGAASR
ncbi:MAG: methyltransferase domain-containing protein [Rubrobacter sp.]|jgi:ubiquinone/menaquinone biosynthesis C-methylase UbiE|nr:methyltransferase domain-containing protein [Rubrobacter sp.]